MRCPLPTSNTASPNQQMPSSSSPSLSAPRTTAEAVCRPSRTLRPRGNTPRVAAQLGTRTSASADTAATPAEAAPRAATCLADFLDDSAGGCFPRRRRGGVGVQVLGRSLEGPVASSLTRTEGACGAAEAAGDVSCLTAFADAATPWWPI